MLWIKRLEKLLSMCRLCPAQDHSGALRKRSFVAHSQNTLIDAAKNPVQNSISC